MYNFNFNLEVVEQKLNMRQTTLIRKGECIFDEIAASNLIETSFVSYINRNKLSDYYHSNKLRCPNKFINVHIYHILSCYVYKYCVKQYCITLSSISIINAVMRFHSHQETRSWTSQCREIFNYRFSFRFFVPAYLILKNSFWIH